LPTSRTGGVFVDAFINALTVTNVRVRPVARGTQRITLAV
jgi:hypothetical protein